MATESNRHRVEFSRCACIKNPGLLNHSESSIKKQPPSRSCADFRNSQHGMWNPRLLRNESRTRRINANHARFPHRVNARVPRSPRAPRGASRWRPSSHVYSATTQRPLPSRSIRRMAWAICIAMCAVKHSSATPTTSLLPSMYTPNG